MSNQAYEKHERLKKHIMRMQLTGRIGTTIEWRAFLSELNKALNKKAPRR